MILRIVLALMAAFVANLIVVSAGEMLLGLAYAPPRGALAQTPQMMAAYVRGLPTAAFVGLLAGWAAGAFAAAATAYLVSRRVTWTAWAGAGFNLLGVVASIAAIPHPLWVSAIGVAAPVVAALTVPRLLARRG